MSDIIQLEPEAAFDDPDAPDEITDDVTALSDVDEIVQALLELKEAGIQLVEEDRPVTAKRTPAAQVLPWEQYLRFLVDTPSKTVRLFSYTGEDARSKARRRAAEVRKRLFKTNPQELWNISHDFVKADESWRVYVSYERDRTETEMAELHVKMLEAQERGRHAAAIRKAEIDAEKAKETTATPVPAAPAPAVNS